MSFFNDIDAQLVHQSKLQRSPPDWSSKLPSDALAGRRILILEDEPLIAMDVEQLCREQGATDVVVMRSLADIGAADDVAGRFDVAILDLMLGGTSTLDFAGELWSLGLPFVISSGYTDIDEILKAFPGVKVIGKPYAGTELMEAVAFASRRTPAD
jgi:DNA-binding response OmpR family regulator